MEGAINDLQPVGLIGLGHMGLPMAQRLKAAGWRVRVYKRRETPNMAQWVAEGGETVDALAGLRDCRSVILSLPATDDVRGVAQQLVGVLQPGALIVDTSTIHPSGAREFAALARWRGLGWLDAPVSGGPSGAAAGTLAVMVGGQQADYDKAMPLFQVIGRTIVHFGDSGSGVMSKLANNTLLAVSAVATCEMLVMVAQSRAGPAHGAGRASARAAVTTSSWTRAARILAQHGVYEPRRVYGQHAAQRPAHRAGCLRGDRVHPQRAAHRAGLIRARRRDGVGRAGFLQRAARGGTGCRRGTPMTGHWDCYAHVGAHRNVAARDLLAEMDRSGIAHAALVPFLECPRI